MTTNKTSIDQPAPPWLLRSTRSVAETLSAVDERCKDRDFAVFRLDAREMTELTGVFDVFRDALRFPDYFDRNAAALRDCLNDMSWCVAPGFVLIITNALSLMSMEPESELKWLLGLFEDSCREWSRPVQLGEWWDRPAVPFHVILQDDSSASAGHSQVLASLPDFS
jgi:hypothetical protein